MGVYKLSTAGGLATPRTNYSSFLAGNPKFVSSSYESIATVTVGSGGTGNITFSSIPSTYTHLQIRAICKSNQTGTSGEYEGLAIRFNSDSGSNYAYHYLRGNGSSVSAGADASVSFISIGLQPDTGYSSVSSMFSAQVIDILDYANTNKYKTLRNLGGFDSNNTGTNVGIDTFYSGLWQSTSAITAIELSSGGSFNRGFTQYTQFALYGIKGA
jgi:hypothetical protein